MQRKRPEPFVDEEKGAGGENKEYNSVNEEYRKLFLERLNRAQPGAAQDKTTTQEEKKVDDEWPAEKPLQEKEEKNATRYYINKLRVYPKEEYREYMRSFREYFLSDIKDPKSNLNIESLFMTTFGFEESLLEPIAKANIHFTLCNDWDRSSKYVPVIRNFMGYKNWTLIHPHKDPKAFYPGAFHPKLWLMKFPNFLRVAVGSGNLTHNDWLVWSNGVWFQDFRKGSAAEKNHQEARDSSKASGVDLNKEFFNTLKDFVEKIMPPGEEYTKLLNINLDDYVFEKIDVLLVSSVPGRHTGAQIEKYGLGKLRASLQGFPIVEEGKKRNEVLTYQTTSLGMIDQKFLEDLFSGCLRGFRAPSLDKKGKANQKSEGKYDPELAKKFKLIYPTDGYISDETIEGKDLAYVLFLTKDKFEKESFIKEHIFHSFEAPDHYFYHHGIIPHLKAFLVTDHDYKISDDAIVYVGSHNCTPSAWGRFEKAGTQLSISNTELGIVYPPRAGSQQLKEALVNSFPFKFPPRPYEKSETPYLREFERE